MQRGKIVAGLFALLLIVCVAACANNDNENENGNNAQKQGDFYLVERGSIADDDVIAEYEGGEILGHQFLTYLAVDAFLRPSPRINDEQLRQELLEDLIMEKWIVEHMDLSAEDEADIAQNVEEIMEEMNAYFGDEAKQEGYEVLHLDDAALEEYWYDSSIRDKFLRERITDQDIAELYEEVQEELTVATVRHLLVQTHELQQDGSFKQIREDDEALEIVDNVYEQLEEGVDFEELIVEYTEDPGSVESKGRYEEVAVANWVPEFRQAVLDQTIGEIGEPVQTSYGFHIIQVEERFVHPLEEVREILIEQLLMPRQYLDFIENDLADIIIELHL